MMQSVYYERLQYVDDDSYVRVLDVVVAQVDLQEVVVAQVVLEEVMAITMAMLEVKLEHISIQKRQQMEMTAHQNEYGERCRLGQQHDQDTYTLLCYKL